MRMGALRAPRDGIQEPSRDDPVSPAPDDERAVERSADAGELRVGHRADPRPAYTGFDLECETVTAEPVLALELDLARRIGSRDVESGERLVGGTIELPLAPRLFASEELREAAGPRPVERLAEGVRKRRPDLLGRRERSYLVRVQVRDRRAVPDQAASTTIVDPWPPPIQAEAKPLLAPRRFIS